jgi:hypothetical protein
MTDNEKNEMIAKWAGFEFKSPPWSKRKYWYTPSKSGLYADATTLKVDFLHSFDAHIKWTIPKLKRWEAGSNQDGSVWFRCDGPVINRIERPIEVTAETLSMATSNALIKLIESEGK